LERRSAMRLATVIFLSCLALAAQVQISVPNPNVSAVEQPPTRPEDLGAVEGSVFNAATGEPVKKAAVVMTRTDGAPNRNAPQQSYSTATDAAGRFTMKALEPGRYRMTVTRNGFVTMTYGARGPTRPGTTLALDRAQKLKDVNFRLTPHGVIAGRILDEDGEPLPFVSVQLVQFQYRQGRQQMNMVGGAGTTAGTTNDLGDYRIFGVAPGKYYLRATARLTQVVGPAIQVHQHRQRGPHRGGKRRPGQRNQFHVIEDGDGSHQGLHRQYPCRRPPPDSAYAAASESAILRRAAPEFRRCQGELRPA
jgi:protocatechuate 3,4-dioxygenase beta subunit